MSDRAAVLFVNQAFYEAFRAGDLETMEQLWAREVPVACIHPGWRALTSRREVMDSWRDIIASDSLPDIVCRGAQVFLSGETAFVVCYEVVGGGVLVATNVFRREQGAWRIMHHQAGPCDVPSHALEDEDDDLAEESAIQ